MVDWDISWTPERVFVKAKNDEKTWTYELATPPYCELCGRKLAGGKICWDDDRHKNLKFAERVFQMGYYFPTKDLAEQEGQDILSQHILGLKSDSNYATPIGQAMALTMVNRFKEMLNANLFVPVPSYGTDQNHAYTLCEIISEHLKQSLDIDMPIQIALRKIKNIKLHLLPDRYERIEAVQNMFSATDNISVNGSDIVLIDDILTVGDTKSECIKILENNGAKKIWVFVAAGGR